jgi:hypothetical protein
MVRLCSRCVRHGVDIGGCKILFLGYGYVFWAFIVLQRIGVYLSCQLCANPTNSQISTWVDDVLSLLPIFWKSTWTRKHAIIERHVLSSHCGKSESPVGVPLTINIDTMNSLYFSQK